MLQLQHFLQIIQNVEITHINIIPKGHDLHTFAEKVWGRKAAARKYKDFCDSAGQVAFIQADKSRCSI